MEKKTLNKKRKVFHFDDEIMEIIESIKERRMLRYDIDAIVYALVETYDRDFNNYKELIKSRSSKVGRTPEEKAQEDVQKQEEIRKAKAELIVTRGRNICDRLEGIEIKNPNGTFGCDFKMYDKVGKRVLEGKRTVPYDMLSESHIDTQYRGGSKEEIIKLIKKDNG